MLVLLQLEPEPLSAIACELCSGLSHGRKPLFSGVISKSKSRACCCSVRPGGNAAPGAVPVSQGPSAHSEIPLLKVGMAQPEKLQAAATCCGQEWPISPSQPAWPGSCEGCLQYHQKSRPETQSASAQRTSCPCRAAHVVALARRIDREAARHAGSCCFSCSALSQSLGSPAAACLHSRGLLQLQGGAWLPAGACLGTGLICVHCRRALSSTARAREWQGRRSCWICSKTGLHQARWIAEDSHCTHEYNAAYVRHHT